MLKTTAPVKSVPLRPIRSPIVPDAREVTVDRSSRKEVFVYDDHSILNAPISRTATIVPVSTAEGWLKKFLK
jgi:hypothetical protein